MSRCFPFPPPGYVKEVRPDEDTILPIKENKKDKKQKKDKKDRKDKEKKEKRDKEKNSEKHKEKKEKKHKHRDKKEKERDKEKEDKRPSEERKIAGLLDHQKSDQRGQTALLVGDTQPGSKPLPDLGRKARNDSNGAREIQTAERIQVPDLSVQSGKILERNEVTLADSAQKFKDRREENRIPNGHYANPNATGLANGFVPNLPAKDQKNVEGGGVPGGMVMEKQKERKDTHKHKDSDRKGDKEKKSKSKDKKRKREKEKEKEKAKANELSGSTLAKLRESGNNAVDSSTDRGSKISKESSLNHQNSNKRKEPEKDEISNGNEIQSNKLLRPTSASHQVSQPGQRIDVSNAALQFGQEATVQRIKSNNKNLPSLPVVRNGMKPEMRQNVTNTPLEKQHILNNHSKANNRLSSSARSPFDNGENLELGATKLGESVLSSADMEKKAVANPATEKKKAPLQHVENGRRFEYDQFNNLDAIERQKEAAKLKLTDKGSRLNGSSVPKLDERASKINGGLELKKTTGGAKCERTSPGPQMDIFETPVKPPLLEVKKPTGGVKQPPLLEVNKPVVKRERPVPGLHKDILEAPVKSPLEPKKPTKEAKCEKPGIFEPPVKPPHPDVKYLDEILTVPKPAEWSDGNDQSWLFSPEDKVANKPAEPSTVIEEPKQVWAEAMWIDSADLIALPYVIPF